MAQGRHDSPGVAHGVVQVSGTGVITGINAAAKTVTLGHQTINNFKLEPGTHEFAVKNSKSLENLKDGDKVKYRLQSSGGSLVLVQLTKVK